MIFDNPSNNNQMTNPQTPQRNDAMKHIEKAFSFLIHIFRAAEKMRPKEKYWHIKGLGYDYYINEKYTHKIGVEEIYDMFSTLPHVRNERLN